MNQYEAAKELAESMNRQIETLTARTHPPHDVIMSFEMRVAELVAFITSRHPQPPHGDSEMEDGR